MKNISKTSPGSDKSPLLIIIIIVASVFAFSGISIAFIDLERYQVELNSASYVSSILSFSGILLFVAALISQRQEYKLQLKEFKKSSEAQQKTSDELEAQKTLLIQQNTHSLIFQMIGNFNDFKLRNGLYGLLTKMAPIYQDMLANRWELTFDSPNSQEEKNIEFALAIKIDITDHLLKDHRYPMFKKFVYMAYNVLFFIDENKKTINEKHFKALFFSQLNDNESIFLYLANLIDEPGEPMYTNLFWGHYKTVEIIEFVRRSNPSNIIFKELDPQVLTTEFQNLKQSD